MAVSPTVNVKDGAGAYGGTASGVNVTPGDTISIQLASVSGVSTWTNTCVYTDELSNGATVTAALTIDNLNKIATFVAPVAGRTYIFQSKVNGGIDVNGTAQPSYTTTFGIYTLTGGGQRVIAANETIEGNALFGWVGSLNPFIRSPAGTGATAATSGTVQLAGDLAGLGSTAAAPTVANITGDVTGYANILAPVKNTSNPKVTSIEYQVNLGPAGVNTAVTALTIPTATGKVYTIRGIVAFHNSSANAYGEYEINAFATNNVGTVVLQNNVVTNKASNVAFVVALSVSGTNILLSVTDPSGTTQSRRCTGAVYVAERTF